MADADTKRLHAAIEELREPLCLCDAEDRVIFANRAFREINANVAGLLELGHPYEEHLRAGMLAGNYPDQLARADEWLANRLATRRAGGEVEVRRQNGAWLLVRDQRLPDGGTLTVCIDITESKRAEEEMLRMSRELEERVRQRTAQLETANRELEAFSYSVSHDLRAPLRAIGAFTRILKSELAGRADSAQLHRFERVNANVEQMGALIEALLGLAQIGRSVIRFTRVDLSKLAADVLEMLGQRGPACAAECTIEPGAEAECSRELMRIVLENLLGNARKFSSSRAGSKIAFGSLQLDNGRRAFYVRDNGIGFDMRQAGKLFRPFHRLQGAKPFDGTGIGLAIVKRIVERHGGRVWAEGEPDAGATFFFTLEEGANLRRRRAGDQAAQPSPSASPQQRAQRRSVDGEEVA